MSTLSHSNATIPPDAWPHASTITTERRAVRLGPWGDPLPDESGGPDARGAGEPEQVFAFPLSGAQASSYAPLNAGGGIMSQGSRAGEIGLTRPTSNAISQGEYDALADLFLSPDHARTMLSQPGRALHGPVASEGGPALRFPQSLDAPIMAGPAPAAVGTASLNERTSEQANDRANDRANDQARAGPLRVEGLILGHLPVLGGAWVGQYAKHVASQSHEPVALLRIQEGQLSIDLVTPIGSAARAHSRVGAPSMDPGATTLEDAIAIARREAGRWLVRVDEVQEAEMLSVPDMDAITLLTGADDAAVVASYRTLKQLCRALQARAASQNTGESANESTYGPGEHETTLSFAILGADGPRADEAEAKLREGARTFLATPLPPAAKVGKISPGTTTTVYRAALAGGASKTLVSILSMLRTTSTRTAAQSQESRPPVSVNAPQVAAPASSASSVPTSSVGPAGVRPVQGMAPLLGLVASDVTCPYAAAIELAWGADGSLHLLAAHDASSVRDLLVTASWANDHRALLQRLSPRAQGMSATSSAWGPTLHVITRDLPAVRALLDTAIRVHVLVEVKMPGGAGGVRGGDGGGGWGGGGVVLAAAAAN